MWFIKSRNRRKYSGKEQEVVVTDNSSSSSDDSKKNKYGVSNSSKQGSSELPTLLSLKPTKKKYSIAIFACGLFWNPQRRFSKIDGIKRCIVGYIGSDSSPASEAASSSSVPTFENPLDYTQAIFIEYNPKKVSYQQLLEFWQDNDYPWEPEPLHLRSAVFTTTHEQYTLAKTFLNKLAKTRPNCQLYVDIESIVAHSNSTRFYQAEDIHQNYIQKQIVDASRQQYIDWANETASSGLCKIPE